ncbi:Interleukin-37 [Myotis brandtii]|uniref:Interleukin-37 n=1 Tax=Myotis brandtii TaxID=109478 RepID=S7NLV1_MYOBR|nr:Interleukin-37 [Myotis brandtii]
MSFQEESAGVQVDSADGEGAGAQGSTEDPAQGALEPGQSPPSLSLATAETFYVLASPLSSAGDKGNPVFLAVSGGKLCLYCEMDKKKGRPTLLLKKKDISQLPTSDTKDSKGFTFYRKKRRCLESAAHQGWFISTCHANEPVRMTDKPGRQELIDFTFMPVSKAHMSPSEVSE